MVTLGPGDVLEITGPLTGRLTVTARGKPQDPVLIRPAGQRAQLRGEGIVLLNPRHVTLRDLDIETSDDHDGVLVWATEVSEGVRLERLSVRGARNGIAVGTDRPAGLRDVLIDACLVHDCLLQGILTFGPDHPEHGLHEVRVTRCGVEGTRGDPGLADRHSGSGIVLGSVVGGEITDCHAEGNGAGCTATEGPEGIFVHDCRAVVIRRCTAVGNRTGGPADGGGLGIDIRCENCVIENCVAEDNDGAGVLLWNWPSMVGGGHRISGNRLRRNCRRTTWHGEITVAPSAGEVSIEGNIIDPGPGIIDIAVGRAPDSV